MPRNISHQRLFTQVSFTLFHNSYLITGRGLIVLTGYLPYLLTLASFLPPSVESKQGRRENKEHIKLLQPGFEGQKDSNCCRDDGAITVSSSQWTCLIVEEAAWCFLDWNVLQVLYPVKRNCESCNSEYLEEYQITYPCLFNEKCCQQFYIALGEIMCKIRVWISFYIWYP